MSNVVAMAICRIKEDKGLEYNKDIGAIAPDDEPDALKMQRSGFTVNKAKGQAPKMSYRVGRHKLTTPQQLDQLAQGQIPTGLK